MLTKNFHQLQAEVSAHLSADRVAQGSYNTCFIGCLAKQENSPDFIESEYGIPLAVSRIAEAIFEGLPSDEAPLFFAAFPDAVESDGKDLGCVGWQFLAAELRSLPPVTPEVQTVINSVIDGIDLLAQGKEWPEEDVWAAKVATWSAARDATRDADWVATWSAARAANAAARFAGFAASIVAANAVEWAARTWASATPGSSVYARVACYRRQRDLLLTLIKKAPITQQENNND